MATTDSTLTQQAAPLAARAHHLLRAWADAAERWWRPVPDEPTLGCFGTGYAHWGVQTNLKYIGAMASLAASAKAAGDDCLWLAERALAAYRFALATHVSSPGELRCPDGSRWGQTWISALGIERMMHGLVGLAPHLTDADHAALRRVLTSEADWLLTDYHRGKQAGILADPWANSNKNHGESNVWNGAMLWRTAQMNPDHAHADAWRERAVAFLVNGVSIPDDATSEQQYDGYHVRDLHVGGNFFPQYAFDHHHYFNVGYMAICVSNAAILHFDLREQGRAAPEALHHHQADLWQVLRRLIYRDGRLARVGGDSRVRYCYCQEFLLPALLYAADHLGDEHALHLADRQLALMEAEAGTNTDGSFLGQRLDWLHRTSLYYYLRLESDRANALGMLLRYLPQVQANTMQKADDEALEASVAGGWVEPEYGTVVHRSPTRLAAFSWPAKGVAQGTCQPPDDGNLAEWTNNLAGGVWFEGGDNQLPGDTGEHRRLLHHHIDTFDGGFVTCGAVMEGVDLKVPDGWTGTDSAIHQIAFAALPDGHTVVGLQHCRLLEYRRSVTTIKGLCLNLPNDVLNANERTLRTDAGVTRLTAPPARDECIGLGSRWTLVADRIGVVGLYGGDELVVDRSATRRGGPYRSLFVEQICWPHQMGATVAEPGAVMLDAGWAVVSTVATAGMPQVAQQSQTVTWATADETLRGVAVLGQDGRLYHVFANFGSEPVECEAAGKRVQLEPARAVVI